MVEFFPKTPNNLLNSIENCSNLCYSRSSQLLYTGRSAWDSKRQPATWICRPRSGQLPGTKPQHQTHGATLPPSTGRGSNPSCSAITPWAPAKKEPGPPAADALQMPAPAEVVPPPSDPELENQINGRLSFKTFLGLSFSQPAPDHSTFSCFRGRLSKEAMNQINSDILRQFEQQGLSINEGIAVDARLVKSAIRPLSQDELKKQCERPRLKKVNAIKTGKPLKFTRDLESDWTVRNDTPHFGLKEHAAVDANHGFLLATTLTPASVHDTNLLPYFQSQSSYPAPGQKGLRR